ncbi:MAG: enoyl-CoA hydratase/isomerase family protein [Terriglobales bacterium]
MESRTVLWEKSDGIGLVTLNRPEKFNALNRELMLDITRILQEAGADDAVKIVIVTGAGKAFCAGGDLMRHPCFETDDPVVRQEYVKEGGRISLTLHRLPKPTIAAVNGAAAGAGMDLALACDIRIASDQARFSEAFVRAGLMPDMGGTWFLPRLVGLGKALELIFTGDTIDAQEAARIGLVNHVVPHDELMSNVMAMARRLAAGPTQSYKLAKWAVYRGLELDYEAAAEHEMFGQNLLLGTEDVKNATRAFAQKAKPVFSGK